MVVYADGSYLREMDAVSAYPSVAGDRLLPEQRSCSGIDYRRLQVITKVIAHGREAGPCADGLAAALIVRNVLPDVKVEFVRYESRELATLPVEPGLLFLDIAPTADRAAEFLEAGALVLDHHATMEKVTRQFEEAGQGAYAPADELGVSAATLAFRTVWKPLVERMNLFDSRMAEVAYFAALAGVYDTWKKDDPMWPEACQLTAALYFFSPEEWLNEKHLFLAGEGGGFERRMTFGAALVRDRRARSLDLLAGAERYTTPKGTRVAVCASSEISEAAELFEDVDAVIGFTYRVRDGKPSVKLSFRSRGAYEVRAIAEALGGGGHAHAASAWLPLTSSNGHPSDGSDLCLGNGRLAPTEGGPKLGSGNPSDGPELCSGNGRSAQMGCMHPYAMIRTLMETW